jgi:hypothetical protein
MPREVYEMETRPAKPAKLIRAIGRGCVGLLLFAQAAPSAAADDPASLDRLHDIVIPPPVPWWPPAPGWHVLAFVLVLLLVLGLAELWQHHCANAYRRAALRELDRLEEKTRWQELPGLLKRVALAAFPRSEVAGLTGASWITWLNQNGGGIKFSPNSARLLSGEVYNPDTIKTLTVENWQETATTVRHWIHSHRAGPSPSSVSEAEKAEIPGGGR